jgi:hypothetical protein
VAGRAPEAQAEGARGARLAGGEAAAAALLGLRPELAERGADVVGAPAGKASAAPQKGRPYVSRSEVRALLSGAAARVPAGPAHGDTTGHAAGRVVSRPAGTRAADASDLQSLLYWRR